MLSIDPGELGRGCFALASSGESNSDRKRNEAPSHVPLRYYLTLLYRRVKMTKDLSCNVLIFCA